MNHRPISHLNLSARRSMGMACLLLVLSLAPVAAQESGDAFDAALRQVQAGELDAAVPELERLRSAGDRRAMAALGAVYVLQEKFQQANDVLAPLLAERQDPGVLYNLGRAAVGLQQYERGIELLKQSAQLAPTSPAVREVGILLGRAGDLRGAFPYLMQWATRNPDDSEVRLQAAAASVQLERTQEAEAMLSDLPQEDPGVQLLWGQTLLLKGDPYGALGYLSPLVSAAPAAMVTDVRRAAARAHLMAGEADDAIQVLRDHAEGNPQMTLQLAQAYYQSGSITEALRVLQPYAERILAAEDASQGGPLAASIALEQGRLLFTDGRPDESLRFLRLATRLDPNEKQAWQVLGQALAASGDTEGSKVAIVEFQRLLEAESRDTSGTTADTDPAAAKIRLAFEKIAEGDPQAALDLMQEESGINPADPRLPLVASRALLALQRPGDALKAAEQSLTIQATTDGLYQRGAVLMSLQRLDEAEESFRGALASNESHGPTLNDLAVLLINTNRSEEARPLLEKALEVWPEDPVAQQNLQKVNG